VAQVHANAGDVVKVLRWHDLVFEGGISIFLIDDNQAIAPASGPFF
jgi:hypothetical protein